MLTPIPNLPAHIFGVRATGEVTAEDLKTVLIPGLNALAGQYHEIYYLLVLETPVGNFTTGAWLQDMKAGLQHLFQWKKMAIVTDETKVENFTDIFSYAGPGRAMGFTLAELDEAITWVSTKS